MRELRRATRICLTCHNFFDVILARMNAKYCSLRCKHQSQRKRLTKVCVVCGDVFEIRPSENKKFSSCSKETCRKLNAFGKSNPNYRNGKYLEPFVRGRKHKEWRGHVYKRDNYTCQMCGKKGGDLNADHIKPWAYFPELRYELSNGRTLCVFCHRKTYKDVFTWRNLTKKTC